MVVRLLAGLAAVGALVGVARGEPRADPGNRNLPAVVWKNRVVAAQSRAGATTVSHTLYLNDCLPDGCTVRPGFDSAQQDASSIPQDLAHISGYSHGSSHWNLLVACVRATFAPFDIQVVTDDPGAAPHSEVMVAGLPTQLDASLTMAGGVAPFVGCGATEDNTISFVFASLTTDINYLCGAVAQEASHVWGLDHELDAGDPMTYLDLGSSKRFQNSNPSCGESLGSPRQCWCGEDTQNSFAYLRDQFGVSPTIGPSTNAIGRPGNGEHVEPGFAIDVSYEGPVTLNSTSLALDGVGFAQSEADPVAANAPPTPLALGAHTLTATSTDALERATTATVTVHYAPACDAGGGCPGEGICLGHVCYAPAAVAGGLGATCETRSECSSSSCGHVETEGRCVASCEAGACPDGYYCRGEADGGDGVCWPGADPAADEGGGCAAGGGSSLPAAALGLAGVVALARRRRRA